MSDNSKNVSEDQQIDLSQLSKNIGEFFENISTRIFRGILFLQRNALIIGILFVLGIAAGFYLDSSKKVYDHKIIVSPNFNSTDYLYSKIELIGSKIKDNDTLFLKNIVGIKESKKFLNIEIKPITDVYKFVENKEQNLEVIKLMAESGDINKVLQESTTSKNYPYHTIIFTTTSQTTDEKTVQPILDYLNKSDYYLTMQKEVLNNVRIKIRQNDSIISQINGFLNNFSSNVNSSQKSDKLVYYNENSPLNDIIKTKDNLINEQGYLRFDLVNKDRIIKDNSVTINIKKIKTISGKYKLILPFLFVALFIMGGVFRSFYRRQMMKLNMTNKKQ